MTKYSAFGTQLQMGNGSLQVETATVVGTITGSGNATFTITAAGMTGSPKAISVPVLSGDTADVVARKAIQVIRADSAVTAMFYVGGTGADVVLTRKAAVANDATLNIAIANDTCTGLTAAPTSANTVAGGAAEVFTPIAQVSSISGLTLSVDTEDVTCHDSPGGWEESIPTILRSGEISLEIVYDPNEDTHDNSLGLLKRIENKIKTNFKIVFPGSVVWEFSGYVTGFEPSMPHDGLLGASVSIKADGQPVLA